MTIKHLLLNFFGGGGGGGVKMCDKMAISAYILKIVKNDPFLWLQMRGEEMFNCHQFFSTNNFFPFKFFEEKISPRYLYLLS